MSDEAKEPRGHDGAADQLVLEDDVPIELTKVGCTISAKLVGARKNEDNENVVAVFDVADGRMRVAVELPEHLFGSVPRKGARRLHFSNAIVLARLAVAKAIKSDVLQAIGFFAAHLRAHPEEREASPIDLSKIGWVSMPGGRGELLVPHATVDRLGVRVNLCQVDPSMSATSKRAVKAVVDAVVDRMNKKETDPMSWSIYATGTKDAVRATVASRDASTSQAMADAKEYILKQLDRVPDAPPAKPGEKQRVTGVRVEASGHDDSSTSQANIVITSLWEILF